MPTDPPGRPPPATADARAVLAALAAVRRRGHWPLFQRLEQAEPDLAGHVLEELSLVHGLLTKSGASPKAVRRLQRRVQSVVLVAWLCLRPGRADVADDDGTLDPRRPEKEGP